MQPDLLPILACPACPDSDLSLETTESGSNGRIHAGTLTCMRCARQYPVRSGIPRFVDIKAMRNTQGAIAENFGDAWQLYAEDRQNPYTEAQFLDWIEPLTPVDFKDQRVLDLGSGLGGFTAYAATYGPRQIVGLEISHAIDSAAHWMAGNPNLNLVQGDILHPPFKQQAFDLMYSIGVLHHLERPQAGFQAAVPLLSDHGRFLIWVYGRENNDFVVYGVEPLRKLASKLPVRFVRYAMAIPLSLVLYPLLHTLYHPALSGLFEKLPYHAYFQWLRKYGFGYVVGMVTDQLIPPRTHYHRREELISWFESAELRVESITPRNNISWRVLGKR